MATNFYQKIYQSKKSSARLGIITTSHGKINTPAFVPVATKGTIKALLPELLKTIKTQIAIVNTYHLVTHPGTDIIKKAGGIHNFSKLNLPLMSDSGGFQVFSLQMKSEKLKVKSIKTNKPIANVRSEEHPLVVKISDDGVKFRSAYDGQLIEFTPEKSIEYQLAIGADIMMAFDECTYYPATYKYADKAMKRTHQWLKRCLKQVDSEKLKVKSLKLQNISYTRYLYGVIQGGTYEDLRKKSAEFVCGLNTDGIAIGGVSVGETKKEMRDQVKWVASYLPADKPVHLLGVGQFDDIIDLVKYGVDTFDCVEPTRLARMGTLYQVKNEQLRISSSESIDINKAIYKYNLTLVDENCDCYVCKNFTKAYLHHLFKQKEILGYTLATYHNLYVMERFFAMMRKIIKEDKI